MEKTNVSRLLDLNGIDYVMYEYNPEVTDGKEVAKLVNKPSDMVFKTLVTVVGVKDYRVFVIPVSSTLDLKKAAKSAEVKSVEMLKQKELLPLTGYIHGGCSPIGMKKPFKTFIDETALLFDSICVSAGKVGKQIEISPIKLKDFINAEFKDLT
ncbi:MAG: Cys-tRNA(Pro) deacylase [Clostridia bacterium]|nr:Cys-tRNA(Pro) deacylase [Clostridia bacterium]